MNESRELTLEMRQEFNDLRRELERSRAEVAALNEELSETNQGVIALYAELDDRAEQLREASELKSRFLSYMSHEFRVPLGAIRSISRILLDCLDGPLSEGQETQVKFIQSSAIELSEMVDDLLDLAKVEAGRVAISPAWFEMVDLFAALRGMFKPLLTNPSVSLVFDEPTNLPRMFSDNKRLSQILRNFISNALKFTVKGEVRVTACEPVPGKALFSVRDTGIGIPENHLGAIFNDFVQVDSPIQKRLAGAGLGLALSKKLAQLLGGSVGVKSVYGEGSEFWVEIPIHQSESFEAELNEGSVPKSRLDDAQG